MDEDCYEREYRELRAAGEWWRACGPEEVLAKPGLSKGCARM